MKPLRPWCALLFAAALLLLPVQGVLASIMAAPSCPKCACAKACCVSQNSESNAVPYPQTTPPVPQTDLQSLWEHLHTSQVLQSIPAREHPVSTRTILIPSPQSILQMGCSLLI